MDFEGAFFDTDDYELTDKFLGEGAFGKVYIAKSLKDEAQYAAKIIDPKKLSKGSQQMMLIRESGILNKLHHPAIIKFYGINFHSFDDESKFQPVIIIEYLEHGSIRDVIDKSKRKSQQNFDATKRYICLLGIAEAMRYLHEHGVIHRDLKLQNVLLDSNYYPRVCDFGLSKCFMESLSPSMQISMTANIGTPRYMAPELFVLDDDENVSHHFGPGIDVYAFSMIMYELVTGKIPFCKNGKTPSIVKLAQLVNNGVRPELTDDITQKMKDLLTRCWSGNPQDRPPFSEIFELLSSDFSYFKENVDQKEVKKYIQKLKDERKLESKGNRKQPEKVVQLSKLLIDGTTIEIKKFLVQSAFCQNFLVSAVVDSSETVCVARIIDNDKMHDHFDKEFFNEVQMQSLLNHKAIFPILGFSVPTKNNDKYAILTPYMKNGSLLDLLNNVSKGQRPSNWKTIKSIIIFGIAAGMAYSHQKNIIHFDLNPSNVVLDENYYPKIRRFSEAEFCEKEIVYDELKGSPLYMSPEMIRSETITKKIDVYSYSLILYNLLTEKLPFYDKKVIGVFKIFEMVKKGERPTLVPNEISVSFEKLIKKCWDDDPNNRPSFVEIIKLFINKKDEFFDYSIVDKNKFDKYVKEVIEDLDLSID